MSTDDLLSLAREIVQTEGRLAELKERFHSAAGRNTAVLKEKHVPPIAVDTIRGRILRVVGDEPTTPKAIIAQSKCPAGSTYSELTLMMKAGLVKRVGHGQYVRVNANG